jgi:hypothetical protein
MYNLHQIHIAYLVVVYLFIYLFDLFSIYLLFILFIYLFIFFETKDCSSSKLKTQVSELKVQMSIL